MTTTNPGSTQHDPKAVAAATSDSLYAKSQKIYPREVHGRFALARTISGTLLLGLFYGMAWVQWHGRQAILWDLPARKFYVFDWVFWPQDFVYLTALLVTAALSLFLFTAIAGRLWCGYACPQTVWTEIFLWMERKVEGDRMAQMRLAAAPLSARKLRIKATKHLLWGTFALFTGFTFVGYFTPIRQLVQEVINLALGPWETFWIFFYGFATYGNAGWMREQVCKYMCPYARFQSAMFDKDTLIISYDTARGEPRGSRKRSAEGKPAGMGDCIDCTMCVQVCPTGIDIRNGLQYECIACSACVDVCDDVMKKMNYAPGLIRYTTQHAMEGKATELIRPRLFVYVGILITVIAFLLVSISQRIPLGLDVIRDRNSLYRENDDGRIENVYMLQILNMDQSAHDYDLTVHGIPGMRLDYDAPRIHVPESATLNLSVRVSADEYDLEIQSTGITFELTARDNPKVHVVEAARFLGPRP